MDEVFRKQLIFKNNKYFNEKFSDALAELKKKSDSLGNKWLFSIVGKYNLPL